MYNTIFTQLYKTAYEKTFTLVCKEIPHTCALPSFHPLGLMLTFIPYFLHSSSQVIQFR